MRTFLLIALAAFSSASDAANPPRAIAYVEWAHGAQNRIIVGDDLWRCSQNHCAGPVLDHGQIPARACRKVHKAAGTVTRFVLPAREFSDVELRDCNR